MSHTIGGGWVNSYLITHPSSLISHHLTPYHSPLVTHPSSLAPRHSPFITHPSSLTPHLSPLITHPSLHTPVSITAIYCFFTKKCTFYSNTLSFIVLEKIFYNFYKIFAKFICNFAKFKEIKNNFVKFRVSRNF